jgi:hypothetical protein
MGLRARAPRDPLMTLADTHYILKSLAVLVLVACTKELATPTDPSGAGGAPSVEMPVQPGKEYPVAGSKLRFHLHDESRANLQAGHAWRGALTVCDGAVCTELPVGGPDLDPGEWHGYRFELVFVDPTSVRVTRLRP